jgi:hypothetical protein
MIKTERYHKYQIALRRDRENAKERNQNTKRITIWTTTVVIGSNDNNDESNISIINTATTLQFHYDHYYGYCYYSAL